ncbi:hypothetical protein K7432_012429 [Basidiobolus ranarum]|uniref:Uncharacterized protein n=1 Tax=Basidiobolus ranarum TaxID=34480 RepID=A0ABR2WKS9_9FUNG
MKFSTLAVASTVVSLVVQSLPIDQSVQTIAGDKRDLHDLCGRWFCGHTKREDASSVTSVLEASIVGVDESPIVDSEQTKIEKTTVNEQLLTTTSYKRDLHDLCGRWFCGHTRKRSVILRNNLRSTK